MTSGERKGSAAVIKSSACKPRCGVTQGAIFRESCLNMVRIRRTVVVREMTRFAGRRQSVVCATRMAFGAGRTHVRARQRKRGCAVIEHRSRPNRSVVARCTLPRESGLDMVWICRAGEVREMTRITG
jgi:hypothetical protein